MVFCATGKWLHLCSRHVQTLSHTCGNVGYDTSFQLPFDIIGRNGVNLNEKWNPHPVHYLSVCVEGFPNMFMSLGPNSGVGSGSLLALIEFEVLYACQAVAKMQRERLKSIEIKPEAQRDFDQYLEVRTVLKLWVHVSHHPFLIPELLPEGSVTICQLP